MQMVRVVKHVRKAVHVQPSLLSELLTCKDDGGILYFLSAGCLYMKHLKPCIDTAMLLQWLTCGGTCHPAGTSTAAPSSRGPPRAKTFADRKAMSASRGVTVMLNKKKLALYHAAKRQVVVKSVLYHMERYNPKLHCGYDPMHVIAGE